MVPYNFITAMVEERILMGITNVCRVYDADETCLDVIIEPLLYISDTHLGRVISQSTEFIVCP